MIELKKEFKKFKTDFKQLVKDENIVIYQCTRKYDNDYIDKYLEVFRYKIKKEDIYHNDEYEDYPSNEDFGNWAWCCSTLGSLHKVLDKHFENIDYDIIDNVVINAFSR